MVIGVQECQLLLLDNQENGIDEFTELRQVIQVIQSHQSLSPCVWVADCVEEAMVVDHRNKLLRHQHKQRERQGSEEQVVDLEQTIQHKRSDFESFENVVPAENHGVVNSNSPNDHRER